MSSIDSIEQLLYRPIDRTSSYTGSPCLSLVQAVLGLMERMLPSQRRMQEKSLWCDVWVVKKEAITGWTERRMEGFDAKFFS